MVILVVGPSNSYCNDQKSIYWMWTAKLKAGLETSHLHDVTVVKYTKFNNDGTQTLNLEFNTAIC